MRILHNHTYIYIVHTIGKRDSLVPHIFNKKNKQSMCILHNHTYIYIVHTIGKRDSLVPHIFKIHNL